MVSEISALRPDVVWLLTDLQDARHYSLHLRGGLRATLVAYVPIDLTPRPADLVEPLEHLDAVVTYTEYGKQALSDAFEHVEARRAAFVAPALHTIPHGVDTETFRPIGRRESRSALLGEGHEDAFIVLNANRNQPRKRIDTTLRAFALFTAGKPRSIYLHLHMGMRDRGWDVRELGRRYGLEDRLIFTTQATTMPFIPDELLNQVYNASDVGLNTATSEGWGLVAFEHGATGAAQVVPGHSVLSELWGGAAVMVPPALHLVGPEGMFDEHYVRDEDVAAALERLYEDETYRERMSSAAYRNATQRRYSWDAVARQWASLLDECLS